MSVDNLWFNKSMNATAMWAPHEPEGDTSPDEVVAIGDYLQGTIEHLDEVLSSGHQVRTEFALRLHALRMAEDVDVAAAEDEYEARVTENRPYVDATPVGDLVAQVRAARSKR